MYRSVRSSASGESEVAHRAAAATRARPAPGNGALVTTRESTPRLADRASTGPMASTTAVMTRGRLPPDAREGRTGPGQGQGSRDHLRHDQRQARNGEGVVVAEERGAQHEHEDLDAEEADREPAGSAAQAGEAHHGEHAPAHDQGGRPR